ncbi:MAG: NADH:flavin oxidoreductase [Acidobacteria bacterium]|nr:NADH:flavin oxidoreductase [Acidobacteriota bacterium]
MGGRQFLNVGGVRSAAEFRDALARLGVSIPCDEEVEAGDASPLARPLRVEGFEVGNRFAVHPMEGWDGTADGRPTELTSRRWRNFGASGAKLVWGCEAVAVTHEGRANPNQLLCGPHALEDLAGLRGLLVAEHRAAAGSDAGLLVGLQLTHSGRFSRPNSGGRSEPRILYRHPLLDARLGLPPDYPLMSDGEVRAVVEAFHGAARVAREAGFDFIDVKHCHGYLGHEFLSAHTRGGDYGGCFENRTRFLREVVEGVRSEAPGMQIGVRLSAFDTVPFRPDPAASAPGRPGPGAPEPFAGLVPYRWGFGLDPFDPLAEDFGETERFLSLCRDLEIRLVSISAGSPYYNPHVQRPAVYPPSDGYLPPEDPLLGVVRQMLATRTLKQQFPDLAFVGAGYTYLQQFLPNVAQAAVREGWVDSVGLGRMVLSYPALPLDVLGGRALRRRLICRTFSDCTTAPRNGLPSGCYPLDPFYRETEAAARLKQLKRGRE